ncbi:N-acetylglucosamine-6-phosphate deacetylase [Paenibacillus sp. FSL H3-0333]|uniref:N-acetylglucosamine-6-phosphate deacetylase n=1 Tax=Paenibacillus sp. FSL H3-0333 TaxID=2921373 RepID=UPI0030F67D57
MNGVISGRHYRTGLPLEVHVNGGVIEAVHTLAESPHMADWPWLAPGLVDLQVNGGWGLDFNTLPLAPETVAGLSRCLLARGVTSYCPTLITNGSDQLVQAASVIAEAVRTQPDIAGLITGIHLEGPFLSPEDGPRGAHPLEHICPPDWEAFCRWQEAAAGLIRIITVSPEWPGATAFISRCTASGVRVSIGHTAASPEQIRQAVAAGAVMSTHLGNGTHLTLPRHPHYLWEQLAADELYGCMIADGCHLPDTLLKVILRVKQSRAILVSDAVSLSGMAPGAYRLHIGGDVVLTPEGRLHLAGHPRLLAGSAMMLADQVAYLARSGLAPLEDAIDCASLHPAQLLGLPQAAGLTADAPADLIGFRKNGGALDIQAVWKNGRITAAKKD